jgi:putative glycosyltransferase (TIGR04372 family)
MKRIIRGISSTIVYVFFASRYQRKEFLVIETNIFGHAILEYVLLRKYILEYPHKSVKYITHSHSANSYLTKIIKKTLKAEGIKESYFGRSAIHGQDLLVNRIKLRPRITFVKFQDDLTHLTASNQNPKLLPAFPAKRSVDHESETKKKIILLMNRSSAYLKHNESSELHAYRNFNFDSIDKAVPEHDTEFRFMRIGKHDEREIQNSQICDVRKQIEEDPALDMAIQSQAFAYFGADSGPAWYALCGHKPVAFTNMIPLNQVSPVESRRMMVIPKLIFSLDFKRTLTLSEMLSKEISSLRSTQDYKKLNLVPIENSNEDVQKFMMAWLNMLNNSNEPVVDEDFMDSLRKKHNLPYLPSISANFLSDHSEVL